MSNSLSDRHMASLPVNSPEELSAMTIFYRGYTTTQALAFLSLFAFSTLFACRHSFGTERFPQNASNDPSNRSSCDKTRSLPCCRETQSSPPTPAINACGQDETLAKKSARGGWKPLFDGRTLKGWTVPEFGGEGSVGVQGGRLLMGMGEMLTGVTYSGDFPKQDYELRLEAMRVDGIDFFCGLTFPVAESHCSLIVGGWAGAVVGLSSIDGLDASENDTTQYMKFDGGKWYRIRLRVTDQHIQAWINDKQVINQDIRNHKISTRAEVDLSKPLGISTWQTKAAIRKVEYRKLPAAIDE